MSANQNPRDWSVLSVLGFYDVKLLRKPLKELTGEEALLQFQFLSSLHAQRKHKKGVSLGLSKVMTKRLNTLGQMLVQGFSSINYSGKVLDTQKPGPVVVIGSGPGKADLLALAAIADLKGVPSLPAVMPETQKIAHGENLFAPVAGQRDAVFPSLILPASDPNTDLSAGKRFGLGEKKPEKLNDNHGVESP